MRPTRVYLGEKEINIRHTEFIRYTPNDWVLVWLEKYKDIGGQHHKDWLLDQIGRILFGTKVIVKKAEWSDGTEEYRYILGEPTMDYINWVNSLISKGVDYDIGIAP